MMVCGSYVPTLWSFHVRGSGFGVIMLDFAARFVICVDSAFFAWECFVHAQSIIV